MPDSPEVMNIRQAADYLGISSDTLYKYLAEERIPAFKLGNRWKFKKSVLDRWMERQSFPVAAAVESGRAAREEKGKGSR